MAEQIISPGVFTRENDLSFLPQGVGQIGAAIIGPTVKGPAFVPTVIRNFSDYERKFGPLSSETFVPQTVREYLKNAGSITVCRVLAGGGYDLDTNTSGNYLAAGISGIGYSAIGSTFIIGSYGSNTAFVLGAIWPSKNVGNPGLSGSFMNTGSMSASFGLTLAGTNVSQETFTGSINPNDQKYLFKQLGYNANNSKNGVVQYGGTPGYTYLNWKNLQNNSLNTHNLTGYGLGSGSQLVLAKNNATTTSYTGGIGQTEKYGYASTPWIQSQISLGRKQLFKFHTIAHGTTTNKDFKISIQNLREPSDIDGVEQYSQFTVIIRKYTDKDKTPLIVEQFNGVNLDPDSPNYISRKIGDRYPQYNDLLGKVELLGSYPNISNYLRVEVDAAVDSRATSPKLSPKGFAAVMDTINTGSLSVFNAVGANLNVKLLIPSSSYEGMQELGGVYNTKGYLGWKFDDKETDNDNWIKPLPDGAQANRGGAFSVENYSGHASSSLWIGSLSASVTTTGNGGPTSNQIKFTVPLQGGEDGIAPWKVRFTGAEGTANFDSTYLGGTNLYGFDVSSTTKAGYIGYKKALDILSNQDEYDINMLALPGILRERHLAVANAGIDMCEGRGDTFFVMDLADKNSSVNNAVSVIDGADSNYTAVYYPWVKVMDTAANKPILVPPSVIVPGAIAQSDRISQGAEWFAPAGLNRGVLGSVMDVKTRLNQAERDVLYENKINPIAFFPGVGSPVIWGQKTLQERSTALDRINVRRLLITVKKFIASSSKYLVFEQNTIATRTRFLNIVNPYLESIQQRQGLYAFRVTMDESNNTPDVIDRNQLVGAIYLQPTKTAEFIILDFNVLPTGATFPA